MKVLIQNYSSKQFILQDLHLIFNKQDIFSFYAS